jgi:hypothetical protein
VEFLYGKDINAIYVRNANLARAARTLPDGRSFYTDATGNNRLNTFVPVEGDTIPFFGGVYVLDNSSEGWNYNITAQLRKTFESGIGASLAYTYLQARNQFKSTEIASVLWAESPVQGNPNNPELSYSEFGNRHRIVGVGNYRHQWSNNVATSFGLFLEAAEGNRFAGAGGNRYSYTYSGDVNGDGQAGNDLIYIPNDRSEIVFQAYTDQNGNTISTAEQWERFNAFIEQDKYLSSHRGDIAERFGLLNEWFWNMDLRILQDFSFDLGRQRHTFQINLDILNFGNLLNSNWGVRKVAPSNATVPLRLVGFDAQGAPVFNYTGPTQTFIDDPGLFSRWQIQLGLRYFFN